MSTLRTYGRNCQDTASKAFDDMLANKPSSTAGNTYGRSSYRSVRKPSSGSDAKRPRLNSDPFSFDSDEEKPSPKKGVAGTKKTSASKISGSPPKTFYGSRKAASKTSDKKDTENGKTSEQKTYSYTTRINRNGTEAKMTFSKSQLNIKAKQMSIEDSFSRKTTTSKFFSKMKDSNNSRVTRRSPTKEPTSSRSQDNSDIDTSSDLPTSSQISTDTGSSERSKGSCITISSSQTTTESSQKSSLFDDSGHDTDMLSSDDEPVFFKHRVKKTFSKRNSSESDCSEPGAEETSPVKIDHPYSIDSNDDGPTPPKSRMDHSYTRDKDVTSKTSPKKSKLIIKSADDSGSTNSNKPVVKSPSAVKNKVFRQIDLDTKNRPQAKALVFKSPKKTSSPMKAAYNARPWSMSRSVSEQDEPSSSNKPALSNVFDANFDEPPTLKKTVSWPRMRGGEAMPKTTVKVNKEHKRLFTVVRNVQEAHECQERGEAQEFEDDLEYIMDGMKDTQTCSVRCLSTISLAQKCTMPAFRMHLRAHGTLTKIFSLLHDAYTFSALSLCVGLVMYMMSRDRLNMDLDKGSLQLMLKLLSVGSHKPKAVGKKKVSDEKEYEKTCEKVCSICEQLQKEGGAKDLDLSLISTNYLAMEALLSLTSKKAGDWFTEELRLLGGLDHIIEDVHNSIDMFIDEGAQDLDDVCVERLSKVDRWLKVLENVSFMSADNQTYMVDYSNGMLIRAVCRALKICEGCISVYSQDLGVLGHTGKVILDCMLAILRVLLNLTHDNEHSSLSVGSQDGLISTGLLCVLQSPQYVPLKERFDILVLGIGLLINLVEHSELNRRRLLTAETVSSYDSISQEDCLDAPEALVQLLLQKLEAARLLEQEEDIAEDSSQTSKELDESGEWHESEDGIEWVGSQRSKASTSGSSQQSTQEEIDLTEVLHKAGKHMEDNIVASYISLLIGCLIQGNKNHIARVRAFLPNGSFDPLVKVLHKFLGFISLTKAVENTGGSSILKVIEILEAA